MQTIDTSRDFDAPADALWRLLEDFGNIQSWWPAASPVRILRVELEGEGIGLVRHIYNEGFPKPVSERLDFLDPANRMLKLSIIGDLPAGMTEYQATGQVESLPGNRCRLRYHGEFTTEPGGEEQARTFLKAVYGLMFDGLGAAAASRKYLH
jgi:hypothetical protein